MEYIEVLNNLKKSINQKHNNELFKISIQNLKKVFGQEISTKFLRNLCECSDFRKQTKRISYLLRTNNLKTFKTNRIYSYLDVNRYKTEVIEYALNKSKKAYIKNSRMQEIGREFLHRKKEVLFMIKI